MGKGGSGKGQGKPCNALSNFNPKEIKALETKLQVKNLSGLVQTLNALEVT